MSDKYNPNDPTQFSIEWGKEIEAGGYVQIPHDFIRNIWRMDISCNEAMIAILIMSYGKDRQISADQIAFHLGICVKTVRTGFDNLDKHLKLVHRNYVYGEASTFSWKGLKERVLYMAKNRQGYVKKLHKGIRKKVKNDTQILPTNKEPNNKNKKEVNSYPQFLKERDRLANDKAV